MAGLCEGGNEPPGSLNASGSLRGEDACLLAEAKMHAADHLVPRLDGLTVNPQPFSVPPEKERESINLSFSQVGISPFKQRRLNNEQKLALGKRELAQASSAKAKSRGLYFDITKNTGHPMPENVKTSVVEFYEDDGYSRVCPGEKDFVSVKQTTADSIVRH
ncbi:hypothetical protein ANN_19934 [Periplaneta americana]|uniref:Uncharacterized protein n=1 Tax=Periplaneta americana TaxID=6978 RepID=A0ABQ8SB83_PERAM|nr:hypothetical protein ANN_19934 [Periplaneta americana]